MVGEGRAVFAGLSAMSRIGKKPIPIPKGVTVTVGPDAVEVQGPKGKLRQALPPGIVFSQEDGTLVARLQREENELRKFHGLARSLVANAVNGVADGFKKELDIVGIGYRAEVKGKQYGLHPPLGFSLLSPEAGETEEPPSR
jgi:large subunit ribosomal protein L6